MEIKNKLKISVILLLAPIWLGHVYGYLTPLSISYDFSLPFAMLLSSIVISLFSYWIKKTVIIPITFLVMGIFLVWWSFMGKGFAYLYSMAGSIFIIMGLVALIFIVGLRK